MYGLEKDDRVSLARMLRGYLKDELDLEIGGLDAEFFLDHLIERLGPRFYNQGLADAAFAFSKRAEEIAETVHDLEKPVPRD